MSSGEMRYYYLQIVFIKTASSQAKGFGCDHDRPRKKKHACRPLANSFAGIFPFALKRWLSFVKDLNWTWNQLFVHFLSTPFTFKDTTVFVVHTYKLCSRMGSLCRMNMQRFRRAKRDEFLIHSADVMRSHSLRNLALTNVMFTEPGPKTIICPWRMGNLLCTGTRSLRLAINNKPVTAQLPKTPPQCAVLCVQKGMEEWKFFLTIWRPLSPHQRR
jgi:hypothetical protein